MKPERLEFEGFGSNSVGGRRSYMKQRKAGGRPGNKATQLCMMLTEHYVSHGVSHTTYITHSI